MTTLERIQILRAEEQVRSLSLRRGWERDSWDVVRDPGPRDDPRRTRCLAGDCKRPVRARGYCHVHSLRIQRCGDIDGPLGFEVWRKGRR